MGTKTKNLNLFITDMNTDGDDLLDFDRDLNQNFKKIDEAFGSITNFVPFCVNSGAMTDGEESLLSMDSDIITAKAPFTLTSAQGVTKTVTENLTLDVSKLADGEYTILYNFDTNALEAFGAKIHIGKIFPDNAVVGDMLFNISCAPYKTELKEESASKTVSCAPIGRYERISGGGVTL